jgi:hypothetical protein
VPIILLLLIIILSAAMAWLFISREANRFALQPPAPLIDLDRMYDVIYERLDEATGSGLTPDDLRRTLAAFVSVLQDKKLIRESVAPNELHLVDETLTTESVVEHIREKDPELDVSNEVLENVVEMSFAYLRDINAVA